MKENSKIYKRNCPSCNKTIEYKTKQGYLGATNNESKCPSCSKKGIILSDETRKKMSESFKGRVYSFETRKNMSESAKNRNINHHNEKLRRNKISKYQKGKEISNETKIKLSENSAHYWLGKKKPITDETKIKLRLALIEHIRKTKLNDGQMFPRYNLDSISILEQKAKELGITDLQHAENGGEFFIEELGYWVDGYSKEKNIVIEYYEKFHNNQIKKDLKRQKEIENFLNCKFIIIKE